MRKKKDEDKTKKYSIKKVHRYFNNRRKNQKLFTDSKTRFVFAKFGIKILKNCILTDKHMEVSLNRLNIQIKKQYKIWYRIMPYKPFTFKGKGVRMGKGHGKTVKPRLPICAGNLLFEISSFADKDEFKKAIKYYKLYMPVKIVKKIYNVEW